MIIMTLRYLAPLLDDIWRLEVWRGQYYWYWWTWNVLISPSSAPSPSSWQLEVSSPILELKLIAITRLVFVEYRLLIGIFSRVRFLLDFLVLQNRLIMLRLRMMMVVSLSIFPGFLVTYSTGWLCWIGDDDGCDPEMEFVQKFTPPDFQAKNFQQF